MNTNSQRRVLNEFKFSNLQYNFIIELLNILSIYTEILNINIKQDLLNTFVFILEMLYVALM